MPWLLAYVVVLGLVVERTFYARRMALTVYGSQAAQAEWDTWRADASKMAEGTSPVKRRVPKSPEPPALVLMRDYFGVCLALAVVLSTVLFATFAFFVRGAVGSKPVPASHQSRTSN